MVGVEPLGAPDASLDGATDGGLGAPTYRTDFDDSSSWTSSSHLPGASTDFGVPIMGANDPSTAEVLFPGHPEYAATDHDTPADLTEIDSPERFSFGTFRTRLQFGACLPSEDVVEAAIGYFHDGNDANQNGITDDLEINFQVLCGTPEYLSLTVFTDNQDNPPAFRKLARVIDFASGDYWDTPSASQEGFTKTGNSAAFTHPELFDSSSFYEIGFEWHTDSLRFFIALGGADLDLWTLSDPTHIPQEPLSFIYNAWHPPTHWFPATGAADFPAKDVVMHIDWFEYFAE
ncbi:MAG TPA: hypothetical protein VHV51_12475 [Polyangiaceae bacterium]|nr:hypothetical protein [Polyangiaceae bacterium]